MHSSGNLQSNFIIGFIFNVLTDCSFLVWVPVHIFGNSSQLRHSSTTQMMLTKSSIYFSFVFCDIIGPSLFIYYCVCDVNCLPSFNFWPFLPFRNINTVWRSCLQIGMYWIVGSLRCEDWRQRGGSPRSLQHRRSVHTFSPSHLCILPSN